MDACLTNVQRLDGLEELELLAALESRVKRLGLAARHRPERASPEVWAAQVEGLVELREELGAEPDHRARVDVLDERAQIDDRRIVDLVVEYLRRAQLELLLRRRQLLVSQSPGEYEHGVEHAVDFDVVGLAHGHEALVLLVAERRHVEFACHLLADLVEFAELHNELVVVIVEAGRVARLLVVRLVVHAGDQYVHILERYEVRALLARRLLEHHVVGRLEGVHGEEVRQTAPLDVRLGEELADADLDGPCDLAVDYVRLDGRRVVAVGLQVLEYAKEATDAVEHARAVEDGVRDGDNEAERVDELRIGLVCVERFVQVDNGEAPHGTVAPVDGHCDLALDEQLPQIVARLSDAVALQRQVFHVVQVGVVRVVADECEVLGRLRVRAHRIVNDLAAQERVGSLPQVDGLVERVHVCEYVEARLEEENAGVDARVVLDLVVKVGLVDAQFAYDFLVHLDGHYQVEVNLQFKQQQKNYADCC